MKFAELKQLDDQGRITVMIELVKGRPGLRDLCAEARAAGEISLLEDLWLWLLASGDPRLQAKNCDYVIWSPDASMSGSTVNHRVDDGEFMESLLLIIRQEVSPESQAVEGLYAVLQQVRNLRTRMLIARAIGVIGGSRAMSLVARIASEEVDPRSLVCQTLAKWLPEKGPVPPPSEPSLNATNERIEESKPSSSGEPMGAAHLVLFVVAAALFWQVARALRGR